MQYAMVVVLQIGCLVDRSNGGVAVELFKMCLNKISSRRDRSLKGRPVPSIDAVDNSKRVRIGGRRE